MNLERIAEIEAAFGEETLMAVVEFADIAEVCRLARLWLRCESPKAIFKARERVTLVFEPADIGKRIALVVLEEST